MIDGRALLSARTVSGSIPLNRFRLLRRMAGIGVERPMTPRGRRPAQLGSAVGGS